jgi:carbon-monoxide dehydrogenase medium subunit
VVALVERGADRTVREAHLALFGVGPTPVRATAAERVLAGQAPAPAVLQRAADLVVETIRPDADLHASAEYRRRVAGVLTRRALALAVERWT